ncbi:FecR family protein [Chitinophaga sp. GCM10012297]|uniref:FecR domain-containing protein n=1 Tax=Chitinophaga chungangae TaxID=2821488 RepID=A0ABS3YJH4_9BACT|nr:FecR family protein [Chitinophaga chungangae]MBO9154843.1 FecR domain-containing protein [Chitinophaga chungangae]
MMKDNLRLYELLLKQHYYGDLTPEEREELKAFEALNPRFYEYQAQIQQVPIEEARSFSGNIDSDAALEDVIARANRLRRKTRVRKMLAGTAAVAAAVMLVIFLRPQQEVSVYQAAHTPNHSGATLTLASGELIAMNDTGRQAIVAGVTTLNNNNRSLTFAEGAPEAGNGLNTLTVPAKLDFQIELPDGTKVWLNSTTRFRFPFRFNGDTREVFIDQGEAYFQVAQNANKPFTVHTPSGPVKVLGTEFNVNAYTEGKVITSLVSGKVAVSSGARTIELAPGNEAVAKEGELMKNKDFDMTNTLSWREGIHYFNNATISEVGIMLKRWFDVELVIDNPHAAAVEIRGKLFRGQPLNNFITQINDTKLVTFYWQNNELHCR